MLAYEQCASVAPTGRELLALPRTGACEVVEGMT